MPVLRGRAAGWCARNSLPEEAVEYSIAAGDVDLAARLVEKLAVSAYRQGRTTTAQRWFRWLDDRGGIEQHPMVAVLASMLSALAGRPVEAERWAELVDRWQYGDTARPGDPSTEAQAALLRAILSGAGSNRCAPTQTRPCIGSRRRMLWRRHPHSCKESRASFPGTSMVATRPLRTRSVIGEEAGAHETLAVALCERSLLAMACGERSRAELLAGPGTHRFAPGRDRGELCDAGGLRGASPRSLSPGRRPGGAPKLVSAQRLRPAADLRDPPLGGSGAARTRPRPLRGR